MDRACGINAAGWLMAQLSGAFSLSPISFWTSMIVGVSLMTLGYMKPNNATSIIGFLAFLVPCVLGLGQVFHEAVHGALGSSLSGFRGTPMTRLWLH